MLFVFVNFNILRAFSTALGGWFDIRFAGGLLELRRAATGFRDLRVRFRDRFKSCCWRWNVRRIYVNDVKNHLRVAVFFAAAAAKRGERFVPPPEGGAIAFGPGLLPALGVVLAMVW